MLSLIGSALGLFSSAIPKALDVWQDRADKAHELAVMKALAEISLDQKTAIDASIREVESIHQHDSQIKGSNWVENTRALVRPIMTYSFMGLFFAVEITAFVTLVNAGTGAGNALQQIWDDRVMASYGQPYWPSILAVVSSARSNETP